MCLERMQLFLKNFVRGEGEMEKINYKSEDKQHSASKACFRSYTAFCNSPGYITINNNNTQNAQIQLFSFPLSLSGKCNLSTYVSRRQGWRLPCKAWFPASSRSISE